MICIASWRCRCERELGTAAAVDDKSAAFVQREPSCASRTAECCAEGFDKFNQLADWNCCCFFTSFLTPSIPSPSSNSHNYSLSRCMSALQQHSMSECLPTTDRTLCWPFAKWYWLPSWVTRGPTWWALYLWGGRPSGFHLSGCAPEPMTSLGSRSSPCFAWHAG